MIINTEKIKSISSKILSAIDTKDKYILNETLELKQVGKTLYFNVTNEEYYVRIGIELDEESDFHATVSANMFLKLISQITTETVELKVSDKSLCVCGNGRFNIPLMMDFDKLMELPEITIDQVTQSFDISKEILNSIVNYNAKEIINSTSYDDILQRSFYIDDHGCITYNTCACINNFTLERPIKFILGLKIVKLFKLFNDDSVHFELGFSQVGNKLKTLVRFSDSTIMVSANTYSEDGLISKFPAEILRNHSTNIYPYVTSIGRNELMQAINRFMIFCNYDVNSSECKFNFIEDTLIIENNTGDSESIKLGTPINGQYVATLDLFKLKSIVESVKEFSMMNISFGESDIFLFSRGPVHNILPECDS